MKSKKHKKRPKVSILKTKMYYVFKGNKEKMTDSKVEVCRILQDFFKKSDLTIVDLEKDETLSAYKEITKIVSTKGKSGSISDKKIKEFGVYLGLKIEIEKRYTVIERK